MKIVTLLENETNDKRLSAAHGLSLYIETDTKKILFDLGPNNFYMKNAKKLGIDLSKVDILVISHGHYDHGTGIKKFLKYNKKAQVFVSKRIFEEHVKSRKKQYIDIGIGKKIQNERITYIHREEREIAPGIYLCDNVEYVKQTISDEGLMIYENGKYIDDYFHHEIYLVIQEDEQTVLFTGCSHKGIENIVDTLEEDIGDEFTHIFGGLHFSHYDSFNILQTDYLIELGTKLLNNGRTNVYAGHCTGADAFFELKKQMKDNLHRIMTGSIVEI